MKRRIIKQGHSTHTITLPAKWIKRCELKAGDEVEIEEQGRSIIINSEKSLGGGELTIDVAGLGPMVRRVIASAYKAGYDCLHIHFESPEELEAINSVLSKTCMGFEVLKQEKNFLVAKKILNVMYDEFDPVLRRVFLSLGSMANDSFEGFKTANKNILKTVILRDDNINKFTDFCRRSLNRTGYIDFKKTPLIYHIVEELEKIGDLYKYICEDVIKYNIKPTKEITDVFKQVNDYLDLFHTLFYKFDLKKVRAIGDMYRKIKSETDKLIKNVEEGNILFRLYYISSAIYDLNGALIAMNLKQPDKQAL